jgi:beta-aspartyl-peptidase (threonine type)
MNGMAEKHARINGNDGNLASSNLRKLVAAIACWCSVLGAVDVSQGAVCQDSITKHSNQPMKYAIALHGGAGADPSQFTDEQNAKRYASLEQALKIGIKILESGGTALDAVEQVVVFLEDDPQFNAGVGAVFNAAGSHELDAAIMDGRKKDCGAVAGVSHIKNPILLARQVMVNTPHVLLAGAGAEEFGKQRGLEWVEPTHFDTPDRRAAWERVRQEQDQQPLARHFRAERGDVGDYFGTVGCVALDSQGNLAAATSTGGMTNKKFGRVGDSPIVGAGTYADNATCAVSGTGTGEQFIRHNVAYDIAARMKYLKVDVQEAAKAVVHQTLNPDDGGVIAVSHTGQIAYEFNSLAMGGAAADSNGQYKIYWQKKK